MRNGSALSVLVLGANGLLGREVVRSLAARGVEVFAFVRRPMVQTFAGVREIRGDALRVDDLRAATGTGVDAVVNAIGAGTLQESHLESLVTRSLVELLETSGPSRLIAMSAGMVVPTFFFMDRVLKPTIFRHILAEHRRVESIVTISKLDWTIVRPPRITFGRQRGYSASPDARPNGAWSMPAVAVATFIGDEVLNSRFSRRVVFLCPSHRC